MPEANVAAILGLRYFGELKKATLTLAWATALSQWLCGLPWWNETISLTR